VTGTITAIAPDDSSFTVQSGGQALHFATGQNPSVIAGFTVGQQVQVSYTETWYGTLVAGGVTAS
jgi:hypothetical protein